MGYVDEKHYLPGENHDFPCQGHALDINNNEINNPEKFTKLIDDHINLFFGESSRGINIELTFYLARAD